MRRYLITSTLTHIGLGLLIFFSPLFKPSPPIFMIDGFDFVGGGGGGNGKSSGGPKAEQMGQIVPAPLKVPLPQKPAPIQKATKAEETWAVKDPKSTTKVESKEASNLIERGEKNQSEKSNIIRRGVDANTTAGDGSFDFGADGGTGKGVGIGLGPGEGGGFGGFGSYLRILRQRIWSEWTQSAVYGSNQVCIVGLTVDRTGNVSDIKIEKPSGNSFYDSVAMRAVRNSSPLPPLPAGFPSSEQRFRIQFRLVE